MNIENFCPSCIGETEGQQICPLCGYDTSKKNDADKLPAKIILQSRFIVGKVLSETCESIIYTGYDKSAGEKVTIKEFFPYGVAKRNPDKTVFADEEDRFAFNDGVLCFLELNEKLAEISLPSLFEVKAVFEQNGTAYAVFGSVTGITLKKFIEKNGGNLKWEQVRPLFLPLLDTVMELNRNDIILGNISPETVIVGQDGRLHLSDILINRVTKRDHDLSAQIYGGYAALEQYGNDETPLGTYTDVYGMSATIFKALIGTVPSEANKRLERDTLSIPAHFADELPRQVLVALANGMQVKPENRTENLEKFKNELVYGESDAKKIKPPQKSTEKKENTKKENVKEKKKTGKVKKEKTGDSKTGVKTGLIAALCTCGFFIIVAVILIFTVFKNDIFKKETTSSVISENSMPEVASIGDYDPDAVNSKPDFAVPDFKGKLLSEIVEKADEDEYKHFKFEVIDKKYSSDFKRGTICEQSIEAGTIVHEDTVVTLVVSLGPKDYKLADVIGKSELEAKVELLKQGILFENIEVVEKYDSDKKSGAVLEQDPKSGTSVTDETKVRIYVNSYTEEH